MKFKLQKIGGNIFINEIQIKHEPTAEEIVENVYSYENRMDLHIQRRKSYLRFIKVQ